MRWLRKKRETEQRDAARSQDASKAEAVQRLFSQGLKLLARGAHREAARKFEEVLPICREVGSRSDQATVLNHLGMVYQLLGRFQEALECLEQALIIRRQEGDRHGEGANLANLAVSYRHLGRPQEALKHFHQALTIVREVGDRKGEGPIRNNLGLVYQDLGQPQEALQHFQQALTIVREVGDRRGEGSTLNSLGAVYTSLGQPQEALEHYQQALAIRREVGDRRGEGITLSNLGEVYAQLGRRQEALDHFQQALVIHRQVGDRRGEGMDLGNLGEVYRRLGCPQEALEHYQQALAIHREVGGRRAEGSALNSLGQVHSDLGQPQEALGYFQQALAIRRQVGDRRGEARALNDLGSIYEGLGRLPEALEHYQQVLAIYREVGDRRGQGKTLNNVGAVYRRLGLLPEAMEHYQQALAIHRQVRDQDGTGLILYNLGLVYQYLGRPQEALAHFEQAIEIAESLRGEILSEELRTSYFATVGDLYASYVSLLVEQGQIDRALHAAERGKARAFLDLLAEAQAEIREGVDPELLEEEQRLLAELRALRQRLIQERSRPETEQDTALIEQLERQEQEIERAYQANQAEIRRRNPRYAALTQPQTWELSRIQGELLDQHTALLEYVLGKEASLLFVVLQDDFAAFVLPPRAEIETKVRELRAAVAWGMHRYPHGYELYQTLIQPAEDLIQDKDLLIVADGALHYLPFALLLTDSSEEGSPEGPPPAGPTRALQRCTDDEERELLEVALAPLPPFDFPHLPYLLRRHALGYAHSATVAGMLRQEVREREEQLPRYDGGLAAFADPLTEDLETTYEQSARGASITLQAALAHTRGSLQRIPFTAEEVWTLAGLVSESVIPSKRPEAFQDDQVQLRTGAAATKEAVTALTAGERAYRFFHIASHGLLDTEKPQFSGLVFTPGEGQDPYWQTFEIFNARIPSELVVLSACETGLGRLVQGEGVVGLTRAFMYAGAPSVCVSLWKVADVSTPSFMQTFYQAVLADQSKARALQRAQLRLLEEGTFAHPFYWAPFVLVGERQ